MSENSNLYDYEIKAENGQTSSFKAKPNKHTKELNLKATKDLFKSAKMNGRITNQADKKEYYIFKDGEEIESQEPRKYGYILKYYDDLNGYHEIHYYNEPQITEINGKKIKYDEIEIEEINGIIGNDTTRYDFYYYKGKLIKTN